jgi:hypothetical protein
MAVQNQSARIVDDTGLASQLGSGRIVGKPDCDLKAVGMIV